MTQTPTRLEIATDLYRWENEEHKVLPMYALHIAEIEQAGGIVDLETGEIFYPDRKPETGHAAPQLQ